MKQKTEKRYSKYMKPKAVFENISEIDKPLASLIRKKMERIHKLPISKMKEVK